MTTPRDRGAPARRRIADSPGRLAGYAAAAATIVALGAWAVWMAIATTPTVEGTLRSAIVHSDHAVTVHFEVAKAEQAPARCKIQAFGASGQPVGSQIVRVPAETERTWRSERLATSARVASTPIVDCHLVGAG